MFYKHDNGFVRLNTKFVQGGPSEFNPLNLPPHTVRVRTSNGYAPKKSQYTKYDSATLVSGTTDVYDVYKNNQSFESLLSDCNNVVDILGANTRGVTSMDSMFYSCTSLSSVPLFDTSKVTNMRFMFGICKSLPSVPLFDTSNVTNMKSMFASCSSLTNSPLYDTSKVTNMDSMFYHCYILSSVPLFDTSNVNDMRSMFDYCYNVQSGALALYQQASTQANPPTYHDCTFRYCGRYTQTGAAELAQIPSNWK